MNDAENACPTQEFQKRIDSLFASIGCDDFFEGATGEQIGWWMDTFPDQERSLAKVQRLFPDLRTLFDYFHHHPVLLLMMTVLPPVRQVPPCANIHAQEVGAMHSHMCFLIINGTGEPT